MNQLSPTSPPSASFSALMKAMESILERLRSVSDRQLKFVRNGDISLLNQLLGHKYKLIEERDRISRRLEPHLSVPPEERRWNSETEKQETEAARTHCERLLAEILRIDQQGLQMMTEQKSAVEDQLRRIHQGSRLHAAYSKQKR